MEATQEARMTYCSLFLPTPTGECMAESTLWTPEVIILDPSATLYTGEDVILSDANSDWRRELLGR